MLRRSPVGTPRRLSDRLLRLTALALLVAAFCAASWVTGALNDPGSASVATPVARIATAGPVDLRQPVFPTTVRLTPGQRRTATVEVRNTKAAPAHVLVRLRARGVAPLLRSGVLDVESRVAGGDWRPVETGPPYDLARIESLPPGAIVPVHLRAQLRSDVPGTAALSSEDLALRILLARAYSADELATRAASRPDPHMELVPLFLGLGMATAGALALALRTRRRRRIRRRWL